MTAPVHRWLEVKVKDDNLQLIPSGLPLLAARHHFKLNGKKLQQDVMLFTGLRLHWEKQISFWNLVRINVTCFWYAVKQKHIDSVVTGRSQQKRHSGTMAKYLQAVSFSPSFCYQSTLPTDSLCWIVLAGRWSGIFIVGIIKEKNATAY